MCCFLVPPTKVPYIYSVLPKSARATDFRATRSEVREEYGTIALTLEDIWQPQVVGVELCEARRAMLFPMPKQDLSLNGTTILVIFKWYYHISHIH